MPATELNASLDALERQTIYAGGEISPDGVPAQIERRRHAALAVVDLLERTMAENRVIRSELEAERRAIDDFATFLRGETPVDEPTAWGSGVRKLVGYAPGQVSTAVSERSIDAWLKKTHQQLSARAEKARQRAVSFGERAQALRVVGDGLHMTAQQAADNRTVAVAAVRRALALGSEPNAVAAAVRHGRLAEAYAVLAHGCAQSAEAVLHLAGGLTELAERSSGYGGGSTDALAKARDAVLAIDWDGEVAGRRDKAAAALAAVGELLDRAAGYVGDTQLVARQQIQSWGRSIAASTSELDQMCAQRFAPFVASGHDAARNLVASA